MNNTDFYDLIYTVPLSELRERYPVAQDFFENLNIPPLDESQPLPDALMDVDAQWLDEFGITRQEIADQLASFLGTMTESEPARSIGCLTIIGGTDKNGAPEDITLDILPGSVVSIVGPTGSGKSRLLADIECLAQGDTPTARRVLIDGAAVPEDERFTLEGKLVAQLSQNMNFVMDLSVMEFLEMHARSRSIETDETVLRECFECANSLAGESFGSDTKVTQLSGGQSRALMIADCAFISQSPIVLIDEIENAGVDRRAAVAILAKREKIVLISTHDPLLALGADRRIVIKNGGIFRVIETSPREREAAAEFERIDRQLSDARAKLRSGERLE
ncbi:MAG: ABC transporter ATP-binding protein [Oscillospiraceae bacterium]|nr:ABC transporter ATP-binding protein [Oscillospiraceae bacterium]